jgi:hypothetical protein
MVIHMNTARLIEQQNHNSDPVVRENLHITDWDLYWDTVNKLQVVIKNLDPRKALVSDEEMVFRVDQEPRGKKFPGPLALPTCLLEEFSFSVKLFERIIHCVCDIDLTKGVDGDSNPLEKDVVIEASHGQDFLECNFWARVLGCKCTRNTNSKERKTESYIDPYSAFPIPPQFFPNPS